ncbi:MAG: hypothetical protein E6I81_11300 [Chloroflexi bacterium]|nr:MAG: hypothetical protein E6I81_11300 [Chloroflexota bacterium]
MARARVIAGLVLLLLGGACGSTPSAQPAQTGENPNVAGVLDRGPTPTCPADEPCDPPPTATMLIFSHQGGSHISVRVAGDGSFALHLDPGAYSIAAAPPAFQGMVEPSTVRVPDTGSVFLRLHISRSV